MDILTPASWLFSFTGCIVFTTFDKQMSTHTANQNQTKQNQDDRRIPKRNPAHILWHCPLEEWEQFMAGELSAAQLKQRYGADETGGDAA